jgi:hypothetical protein
MNKNFKAIPCLKFRSRPVDSFNRAEANLRTFRIQTNPGFVARVFSGGRDARKLFR